MIRVLVALLVLGGIMIWQGIIHLNLAQRCHEPPAALSAKDVAAGAWEKNANLVVSDFLLCGDYLYQKDQDAATWMYAFVPMIEIGGADAARMLEAERNNEKPPAPRRIAALIKVDARGPQDVERMYPLTSLAGIVINDIEELSKDQQSILNQHYPGIDLDSMPIIEYKRSVPGTAGPIGLIAGGVAMLALTGWLAVKRFRRDPSPHAVVLAPPGSSASSTRAGR